MANPSIGVDAWFEWAGGEITKPYGLRHVIASAAKAVAEPENGHPLFGAESRLGKIESRYATPNLHHRLHKPAFEHVLLFSLERMGKNPMQRQEVIGLCEELSGLNISQRLFGNLQLLRVSTAAQAPRIKLSNAPSATDLTAFRHAAESGEGMPLQGRDLTVQRRAYTFTQNYAVKHSHGFRTARAA